MTTTLIRRFILLPVTVLMISILACTGSGVAPAGPITPTTTVSIPTTEPSAVPDTPLPQPTGEVIATPTLVAPTPTRDPAAPDLNDYGVVLVPEDDALNVRSGPGIDSEVVATFAPIFAAIAITGPAETADDGGLWVPVKRLDVEGWVNRTYLTQVVDSDTFCGDVRSLSVINDFLDALAAEDGDALASLIHPERGLFVRMAWWTGEAEFTQEQAAGFFTDSAVYDWGIGVGSGEPITGTAAEVLIPVLARDALATNIDIGCNELLNGPTPGLVVIPTEYMGFNYYALYRASVEGVDNELDWGTWAVGIEYRDDTPYLAYLIGYHWEP